MLSKGKAKKNQRNSNKCQAELTENVEGRPHFSFFGGSENGTGARPSLQKMWTVDRTFLFLVGLNFEQVPVRAYRNCGEWTALFFFLGV